MPAVRVLILRAPGANCDVETAYAFSRVGADADRVHVNRLRDDPKLLRRYQVLCLPGGFAYGDDVAAGKILAVNLRSFLSDEISRFRDDGKLILGICNGFQVLLKSGLLLPPTVANGSTPGKTGNGASIAATLAHNACGRFEDRWVRLKIVGRATPFLDGYEYFDAPVAHAEGRFVCRDAGVLADLESRGQVVLKYVDANGLPGPYPVNPNGSQGDVAGICDATGRILGLMPHPERHVLPTHHPQWPRRGLAAEGDGLRLFRNAVRYCESS